MQKVSCDTLHSFDISESFNQDCLCYIPLQPRAVLRIEHLGSDECAFLWDEVTKRFTAEVYNLYGIQNAFI